MHSSHVVGLKRVKLQGAALASTSVRGLVFCLVFFITTIGSANSAHGASSHIVVFGSSFSRASSSALFTFNASISLDYHQAYLVAAYGAGSIVTLGAKASDRSSLATRLDKLNEEIRKLEKKLSKQQNKNAENRRNIAENNAQLNRIDKELRALSTELQTQNEQLEKLRIRQSVLRKRQNEILTVVEQQLLNQYLYEKPAWMRILGEADLDQIESGIVYHAALQKKSEQLISANAQTLDSLVQSQLEIDTRTADLKQKEASQKAIAAKLSVINSRRQSKQVEIEKNIAQTNASVIEQRAAAKALEQALKKSLRKNRYRGRPVTRGRFISPVSKETIRQFGDQRFQTRIRWQGQVYATNRQSTVHASADGTVIFADYLKGYGNLMILDHGNAVLTLYAYLDTFKVGIGASVSQKQAIAHSGLVEPLERAGLYFEMRHKGKAVNPDRWLGSR